MSPVIIDLPVPLLYETTALKYRQQSPRRGMGPAHWDPKAISPFALSGVKKHRLFEELARSFCALDRQGKRAADGPGPDPSPVGGGMVPFSIFVVGRLGSEYGLPVAVIPADSFIHGNKGLWVCP